MTMNETCKLDALRAESERLRDWMFDDAFPLWAGAGMHASGASWEALDFDGEPVPSDTVRVRVQARQLFVFALASRLGWQPETCARLIESLFGVLVDGCRRHDGLFGKVYNLGTGELVDDTFSLYDTAFAILGFAAARNVLGSAKADAAIQSLLASLEQHVAHKNGGFLEEVPAPSDRLQNPHMHLFESFLALRDAGYDDGMDDRLQRLSGFISNQFFDRRLDIVHERRPGDLSRDASFEPGHSMEWIWLLAWQARAEGTPIDPIVPGLYRRARASLNRSGYACMEASIDGARPDPSCRLWAQAETLKAYLSMAVVSPGADRQMFVDSAAAICRGIDRDWLSPAAAGGWYDHLDESGRLIAADMPASTGYHLFGAIEILLHTLERLEAPEET